MSNWTTPGSIFSTVGKALGGPTKAGEGADVKKVGCFALLAAFLAGMLALFLND